MSPSLILLSSVLVVVIGLISLRNARLLRQTWEHRRRPPAAGTAAAGLPAPEAAPLRFRPHLGGGSGDYQEPEPDFDERTWTAEYGVIYPSRIYVNQPFTLRVRIGSGVAPAPADQPTARQGGLNFIHRYTRPDPGRGAPAPELRVELTFNDDEFAANTTRVERPLRADGVTEFCFYLKPLKAEDVCLSLEILYLARSWIPATVTEITFATNGRNDPTITKTLRPGHLEQSPVTLAREDLLIHTKRFLGLNAAELGFFNKALAIVLTLAYVGLALGLGLAEDRAGALATGLTALASILGVPLATDLWAKLSTKSQEARASR